MAKSKKTRYSLSFAAFICFLVALALTVLLRAFKDESFLIWYNKYTDTLIYYEQWMQTYGATWISALLIVFNFVLKALIPWFPISCICVVSGVLFKWYYALLINIVGAALLFTVKFFWGKRFGAGNAEKILAKNANVKTLIDSGKIGSNIALFGLRFSPLVPINSVSSVYGTTDMPYLQYVVISVAGFSYKLFSYTVIGRNVYDPASASFIVPFIILFIVTGFILLFISAANKSK